MYSQHILVQLENCFTTSHAVLYSYTSQHRCNTGQFNVRFWRLQLKVDVVAAGLRGVGLSVIHILLVKHEVLRSSQRASGADVTAVDMFVVIVATPTGSLIWHQIVVLHATRLHVRAAGTAVAVPGNDRYSLHTDPELLPATKHQLEVTNQYNIPELFGVHAHSQVPIKAMCLELIIELCD